MLKDTRRIPLARFESKDIGPGFIWGAVGACGGVLIACALLVAWLYPHALQDRRLPEPLPLYPAPRLQTDPAADMRSFRARKLAWLDSAGWVDQNRGIAHIPIGEAMQQIAREGVPGWPAPAAGTSAAPGASTP